MDQHILIWTQQTRRFFAARVAWLAGERGDVPGWVLITLMTAGLVVALWALAGPSLGQVFNQAITRVVSF
jgi:hypothetical protein